MADTRADETVGIDYPIDGFLDLHTFNPREVKTLIADYLEACRERGILHVRIVHGKGTGQLRATVHAVLRRLPGVEWFRLAGPEAGAYGATEVGLSAKNLVRQEDQAP